MTTQSEDSVRHWELRSISLWSVIKIGFFVNLVGGFVFGLLIALFESIWSMFSLDMMAYDYVMEPPPGASEALYLVTPFLTSFGCAFFGTILLFILAALYNFLARIMGGIELNLVEKLPELAPSAVPPAAVAVTPPAGSDRPGDRVGRDVPPPPPPLRPPEPDAALPAEERLIEPIAPGPFEPLPVEPPLSPEAPRPDAAPRQEEGPLDTKDDSAKRDPSGDSPEDLDKPKEI